MPLYLYRRGDGNEGAFPRYILDLQDKEDAYAALKACTANDYIAGKRVRRHIMSTIQVDGELEFGLSATIYDGPDGEQAFGSAWLVSELQPLTSDDVEFYADRATSRYTLRQVLDNPAWRYYRKETSR